MKTRVDEQQSRVRLPILIRYRAQDYQTRYLDDPRVLYVDEFRAQHPDDGFLAIIPSDAAMAASAKRNAGSKWLTLGWSAMTVAALSWTAYQLFSIL